MAFTKEELKWARSLLVIEDALVASTCWTDKAAALLAAAVLREAERVREDSMREVLNHVCGELPDGWFIDIELSKGSGSVLLFGPDGDQRDFSSNRECMADELRDAMEHAKHVESGEPE